jgi:hypothetical protein
MTRARPGWQGCILTIRLAGRVSAQGVYLGHECVTTERGTFETGRVWIDAPPDVLCGFPLGPEPVGAGVMAWTA